VGFGFDAGAVRFVGADEESVGLVGDVVPAGVSDGVFSAHSVCSRFRGFWYRFADDKFDIGLIVMVGV
jgi:hypothetical protein